jgi:hypothetical protein
LNNDALPTANRGMARRAQDPDASLELRVKLAY